MWTTNSFLKRLLGTVSISAVLLTTAGAKELETRQVQISELISDSRSFIGQKVIVAGVLHLAPSDFFAAPRFVLVDNAGNAIPVTTWAPLEIPPFMPDSPSTGAVPQTMRDYVGRELSLTGDYRITIDNTFQIVTESAVNRVSRGVIAEGHNVEPISSPSKSPGEPRRLQNSTVVPLFKSGPPLSAKAKG